MGVISAPPDNPAGIHHQPLQTRHKKSRPEGRPSSLLSDQRVTPNKAFGCAARVNWISASTTSSVFTETLKPFKDT